MCGLAGLWRIDATTGAEVVPSVNRMAQTLTHRGPDDVGVWSDRHAGVAFGFRRLAILDLSPTGHQPMTSTDGRWTIAFNGEIYNFRELRAELAGMGTNFAGTSDTEVILAAVTRWGAVAALERLWGMFAIALWDSEDCSLLLARDRVGKKPLYYAARPGAFLFGSELKALRACPRFDPEIDRDALATYVRFGYVPSPYSIYRDVFKLPQGSYLVVRNARPGEVRTYWDPRAMFEHALQGRIAIDQHEAIEELDRLLRDAVRRRMVADVPLGAFLSGGVDSSTVVALMQAQSSRPVRTFSIGFWMKGYNEAEEAKAVASHLGTCHTELYVTPEEAASLIPELSRVYDEPFADSSQIPTCLVSNLARRHVTVSLSGDGGDELFGGYTRYTWATRLWRYVRPFPASMRRRIASALHRLSPRQWDQLYDTLDTRLPASIRQTHVGDKMSRLADAIRAPTSDELYRGLVSQWQDPSRIVRNGHELSTWLDRDIGARNVAFDERMMFLDFVSYLPDDILTKLDRATMAVGLEGRAPLLDHRVVEWTWRLPMSLKRRGGASKWLLRQVLYRYVPAPLIERPKMGFGVPIGDWIRGPLREWAEALLDSRRLHAEGYFDPTAVRAAWDDHTCGRSNEQYRLWTVLMFQAWLERWNSSRGRQAEPLASPAYIG